MKRFTTVQFLVALAVSTVLAADYDDPIARYKFWPMASAAYSDNPAQCVSDNFAHAQFKNQYTVVCDDIQNKTCSGFTAVSINDKAIILSFRGDADTSQVLDEIIEELFDPLSPFVAGGAVGKYFLDAFNAVWNAGMKNDFLALKNQHTSYEVWVTGHSLGGAMAALAATSISKLGYMTPAKIKLITFGEPRVGNVDFAATVDSLVPYTFRVTHAFDMFVQLPQQGGDQGYQHHKAEIWYDNNMAVGAAYVVCDEDEGAGCSDGFPAFSLDNHHFYFNTGYLFAMTGCPGYNPNP